MNRATEAPGVLETAANTMHSVASELSATVDSAKTLARSAGTLADQRAHERPWQTAMIAAGVGLLVGWLLRTR